MKTLIPKQLRDIFYCSNCGKDREFKNGVCRFCGHVMTQEEWEKVNNKITGNSPVSESLKDGAK